MIADSEWLLGRRQLRGSDGRYQGPAEAQWFEMIEIISLSKIPGENKGIYAQMLHYEET